MIRPVSDITALVFDYGNSISFAQRLAKDCKKVYYCTNWQRGFPKWNEYSIGINVPGIERVDDMWEVFNDIDMFCFPDLYQSAFQEWLVSKGKVVFGAKTGEYMEIYRDEFKGLLKDAGLPVNEHKVITGFSALKEFLDGTENKWIKTSLIRGNGETFFYINKKLSSSRMDELKHTLGAFQEYATFVVEDEIPDAVEIGYDGFAIDGKYPDLALTGVEIKDCGYVGGILPYYYLPDVLKEINDKIAGVFAGSGYKCFFSNEVRWTGKEGYFIDPTCRQPQPPGDLMQVIFSNFSDVIWETANGIVPKIIPAAKFGAQIIIKSSWAATEPQAVYFPEKYADRVKIKNLMYRDDGIPCFIPLDVSMEEIGSVCGIGNTIEEAIADAQKIAKTVEGDCIRCGGEALEQAAGEIKKLETFGIKLFPGS